jgi:hypothetical protein
MIIKLVLPFVGSDDWDTLQLQLVLSSTTTCSNCTVEHPPAYTHVLLLCLAATVLVVCLAINKQDWCRVLPAIIPQYHVVEWEVRGSAERGKHIKDFDLLLKVWRAVCCLVFLGIFRAGGRSVYCSVVCDLTSPFSLPSCPTICIEYNEYILFFD